MIIDVERSFIEIGTVSTENLVTKSSAFLKLKKYRNEITKREKWILELKQEIEQYEQNYKLIEEYYFKLYQNK